MSLLFPVAGVQHHFQKHHDAHDKSAAHHGGCCRIAELQIVVGVADVNRQRTVIWRIQNGSDGKVKHTSSECRKYRRNTAVVQKRQKNGADFTEKAGFRYHAAVNPM